MAVAFRNVEDATLANDGSPPITRTTFPTCRAHYPGGSSGCSCRFLRLTLLAPDIVEAILSGRQPAQMTLAVLMRRFPVLWSAQRSELLHPA